MASNFITLNEIIDSIELMDNEAQYGHHLTKPKKRALAMKGLRELNLDVARSVKGKKLELSANGSITLPDDYMDYVGIFTLNSLNQLRPLSKNNRINISNEPILDQNNEPILDHNNEMIYSNRDRTNTFPNTIVDTNDNNRRDPYRTYEGFYGIGGGYNSNGYYRIDYEDNTIQFDTSADIEFIYLEYISNGLEGVPSSRITIPVQVAEALEAFVMWKSVIYQRGLSAVEKNMLRSNFYTEKRKASHRMNKLISQEVLTSSRIWNMATVKR